MTTSEAQAALIREAIAQASAPVMARHDRWQRVAKRLDGNLECAYCLAAVGTKPRSTVIDYLVPVPLGGPSLDDNRVLSCPSCSWSKGTRDLISWPAFDTLGTPSSRQALLDRRRLVLSRARNHLTHTPANAAMERVVRELEKRWENPRFTVYAVHGPERSWIGWTHRSGAQEALGLPAVLLRFACEAVPASEGKVTLYELPSERFMDAVWCLIEHNGIVFPLTVEGVETVPVDAQDWRHQWGTHLEHLSDLRRRRARQPGVGRLSIGLDGEVVAPAPAVAAPHKPRELSSTKRAVKQREARAKKTKAARMQTFLEARARFDAFREAVEAGRVERPTYDEMVMMELEVLKLLD